MILHGIELSYVGPFRETVRIGPFAPGLNLLCAPNEAGKSTSLRAAARALFDRHTTKGEELKSLQPAGTDLAPRIAVEFETRTGRYRIEKTFLLSPRSLLQQWQGNAWKPLAEADAADQRMQDLLSSTLPGRGATRPEHWGFLGFLWARQGEPTEWPRLEENPLGQQIRARLARVELDPVIEQLRAKLAAVADGIVTSTGQPRTGGPLRQAEDDLAAIESELSALRSTQLELAATHQRYQRAVAAVAQLEQEHGEREVAAKALAEQALAAERLRGELETRQVEFAAAQEKLNAIAAETAALAQRQAEIAHTRGVLSGAEAARKAAELRLAAARDKLDRDAAARPVHEGRLSQLRASLQRTQGLLRLRQLRTAAAALEKQVEKATAAAAQLAAVADQKAKLPALSPARIRRLEELSELRRTQRTQLEALGVTVDLIPDASASASLEEGGSSRTLDLPAGAPTRLHRPQALDLRLTGWGRVIIRSGAKEAQTLAADLAATEKNLEAALVESGVVSLEAARDVVVKRKDLDAQVKIAEGAFAAQLGEHASLDALRTAAAAAVHRVDALTASLQPSAAEAERSNSELEADEAQRAAEVPAAENALAALDQGLAAMRLEERAAAEALQKMAATAGEHRTRLLTLESQVADLAVRYPQGVETAKARSQVEFTQAEARLVATRARLPAEFEKLPERNRRAATALQQLANELQARRSERDNARGALETLGGQGLHTRENELEEKKAEATLRRDAARARGWAARIAQTLIEHRKQAAHKAVLTPLEQRLSAAFAELTGEPARRVFLNERLEITGIGATREGSYPFELLSQGAKEQLLLCLRIAVAQELAASEPQVLILDDVLVNTDALRQERVLDVLSGVADRLQVIVLTCHTDRYRGCGHTVKFRTGA